MTSKNCRSPWNIYCYIALSMILISAACTWGQAVVATVATRDEPFAVAVNSATNKIYVAAGNSWTQVGTITIIDGTTNSATTVKAGIRPFAVAVNPTTNKIYVANRGCAGPLGCGFPGSITVLDGATNSTTTIVDPNANGPSAIAVNLTTNKIYVANYWTGNVTVIDGATNSILSVTDPNAKGMESVAVAINPVSNKIYIVNNNQAGFSNTTAGNVTIIDGATNSTATVIDPNAKTPIAVAINPGTDKIYVANEGAYPAPNHGNVTVIDGATNSTTTVTDSNALAPFAVVVNPATNKIYVANRNDSAGSGNGGVTIIDGDTNAFTTVRDPTAIAPTAVAVDPSTNKIYVANYGIDPFDNGANPNVPGSVTVIDGATNSTTTVVDPNAINPIAVTVDSATDRIYAANIDSSNVTVIDGEAPSFTLSVADTGSGVGTITSNPAGIRCDSSCSANFAPGTPVTLTASAASGSIFSGWGGGCSGTDACNLTMDAAESVTATFNATAPPDFSLTASALSPSTVNAGQSTTGTVTVNPSSGFSGSVTFTCSVAPTPSSALTCSVAPSSHGATVTVLTNAPHFARTFASSSAWFFGMWLPLVGFVTTTIRARGRQKRIFVSVLCAVLLSGIAFQLACGGGAAQLKQRSGGTPPGNYTILVTGTSGPLQHSASFALTVE